MFSSLAKSLWIRGAVALFSAVNLLAAPQARADVKPWPSAFRAEQMPVSDGTQYVRIGGAGPAVVLLHGFGDTGDMWVPLAEVLMKDHTVIVPDLRGMGLSSHPEGGYRKVEQARDLARILDRIGVKDVTLVTHDIGNMVGYAFAAQYPGADHEVGGDGRAAARARSLGRPVEEPESLALQLPRPRCRAPGRRDANAFCSIASTTSCRRTPPASTKRRASIMPRSMPARCAIHNALGGQFAAFAEDAVDNQKLLADGGKLTMPVLAIGGDHSYGAQSRHRGRVRGDQCSSRRHQGLRPLDHGRAARSGDRAHHRFHRQIAPRR